jgi:hypothetical protein
MVYPARVSGLPNQPPGRRHVTASCLVALLSCFVMILFGSSISSGVAAGLDAAPTHWYAAPGHPLQPSEPSGWSEYTRISCGAPGFCVAIGAAEYSRVPIAQVLRNGVWANVTSVPAADEIDNISCAAANICEGLGIDSSTTPVTPLAFSYANGVWSWKTLTGEAADLTDLSCPTSTYCGAIGLTSSEDVVSGSLTDGTWSAAIRGFEAVSSVYNISCPSANYCASIGETSGTTGEDNLMIQAVNGVVTEHTAPSGFFYGMACPATSRCFVAGNSTSGTEAVWSFKSGVWSSMPQPTLRIPPPNEPSYLTSISCATVSQCVAVGSWNPSDGADLNLVETLDNGVWVKNPSQTIGTQSTSPNVVSCTGSFCLAVGDYVGPSGLEKPMLMGEGVTNPTTHLSIRIDPTTASSGTNVDYDASVTSPGGTPTGAVTFTTGSLVLCTTQPLVNGAAGCETTKAPVGHDVITAVYSGDTYFHRSTTTGSLIVTSRTPTGPTPPAPTPPAPTPPAPTPPAPTPPAPTLSTTVGMTATPDGSGYWLADSSGAVSAYGSAHFYGSMAGQPLVAPIAHIVSTPDGKGYWLVASDGGIFNFGDAGFFGSMGGRHLNAPVVGLGPTRDGHGYWLVASDGGVFSFGDAGFRGSMGGTHLNQPVVGISADPATGGYWEVAADGGVFSFGAPFFGSTGDLRLNRPVEAMTSTRSGNGYWFVASDGGIFAFGDAGFHGSMGGTSLNAPVVGMTTDSKTGGYWLVASDGGVFSFDSPYYGAGD